MARKVQLIGVPTDYGTDRRGVDMGPSAIRYAGLADAIEHMGDECLDAGDLPVPHAAVREPDSAGGVGGRSKYLDETEEVCQRLADEVAGTLAAGRFPLVLGGDHSIAIGSITGAARGATIGVLWFDAHGDFNTPETTPSGNVHGMPLAAVLGRGAFGEMGWARAQGLAPRNVAIVGLRDLDSAEREALRDSAVTALTMSDIDERGVSDVVEEALDAACTGVDSIHVSVDMDVLDPKEAPGVGTPVRGGLSYREAHSALEAVAERDERHDVLRSLEFVEVNPILDHHNETAELAVELAASALGKRVL